MKNKKKSYGTIWAIIILVLAIMISSIYFWYKDSHDIKKLAEKAERRCSVVVGSYTCYCVIKELEGSLSEEQYFVFLKTLADKVILSFEDPDIRKTFFPYLDSGKIYRLQKKCF